MYFSVTCVYHTYCDLHDRFLLIITDYLRSQLITGTLRRALESAPSVKALKTSRGSSTSASNSTRRRLSATGSCWWDPQSLGRQSATRFSKMLSRLSRERQRPAECLLRLFVHTCSTQRPSLWDSCMENLILSLTNGKTYYVQYLFPNRTVRKLPTISCYNKPLIVGLYLFWVENMYVAISGLSTDQSVHSSTNLLLSL